MHTAKVCWLLNSYPWLCIPLSYIIYRVARTVFALFEAIYLYHIYPFFCEPDLNKFKNRWTVVTGGTDGIGKAYLKELARRGLRCFMVIGRNQAKLDAIKNELEDRYPHSTIKTYLFDFNSGEFEALRNELSAMDIGLAINSVGVGREYLERFGDNPDADSQILRVNALGSAEFISAVLPPMEKHGGGKIVVLSSSQGVRPIPLLAAYSASKSLISFIAEAVNREYSTIYVQCLTPALVATNMTYYRKGSLFVVTPENFARSAVNVLGASSRTSGCFNHEIQMLIRHLFPWAILKHLIMPIYWLHQQRLVKLHRVNDGENGYQVNKQQNVNFGADAVQKENRIETSNNDMTIRNRA